MSDNARTLISGLSLSALGLVMWALGEGWSGTAVPPIPGDVPTHGFGTTTHADGTPLKLGEPITPPQAVRRVAQDAIKFTDRLKRCIGRVELYQYEMDAYVLLGKNVGDGAVCNSSIPGKLKRGAYEAACATILDFRRAQGRDCSLSANQHFCGGVWKMRQNEYKLCMTGEYSI